MLRSAFVLRHCVGIYFQAKYYSMDLSQVVKRLNSLAPTTLAESWDNVGLLVEPHTKREIKTMMLTNDLTEEVMDEAEQCNVNFILSYHPPVFRPLKKITSRAWKERIVARCLEKGIAIYSPHTSYDALQGGVNDWLIQAFEETCVVPVQHSSQSPKDSHQVTIKSNEVQHSSQSPKDSHQVTIKSNEDLDATELMKDSDQRLDQSKVAVEGMCVVPVEHSSQFPKYSHQVTINSNEDLDATELMKDSDKQLRQSCSFYTHDKSLVILCGESQLPSIVSLIGSKKNQLQFTITKLEQVPIVGHGMGRKCKLSTPITLREAVNKIKSHLKLPHVRLAMAHGASADSLITSVAVCAGSGSSVLRGVQADLWLTGEMSHHEVLDATHQGTSVVLTDHSNTERGFLRVLQPRLTELLDQKVQVIVSEKDRDPLQVM